MRKRGEVLLSVLALVLITLTLTSCDFVGVEPPGSPDSVIDQDVHVSARWVAADAPVRYGCTLAEHTGSAQPSESAVELFFSEEMPGTRVVRYQLRGQADGPSFASLLRSAACRIPDSDRAQARVLDVLQFRGEEMEDRKKAGTLAVLDVRECTGASGVCVTEVIPEGIYQRLIETRSSLAKCTRDAPTAPNTVERTHTERDRDYPTFGGGSLGGYAPNPAGAWFPTVPPPPPPPNDPAPPNPPQCFTDDCLALRAGDEPGDVAGKDGAGDVTSLFGDVHRMTEEISSKCVSTASNDDRTPSDQALAWLKAVKIAKKALAAADRGEDLLDAKTWKKIAQEEWDALISCGIDIASASGGGAGALLDVLNCAADLLIGYSFNDMLRGLKLADRLGLDGYTDLLKAFKNSKYASTFANRIDNLDLLKDYGRLDRETGGAYRIFEGDAGTVINNFAERWGTTVRNIAPDRRQVTSPDGSIILTHYPSRDTPYPTIQINESGATQKVRFGSSIYSAN